MRLGRVKEGLRLVDEALAAAAANDAVADRDRHRLLQHHRVLPGRATMCDACGNGLVR